MNFTLNVNEQAISCKELTVSLYKDLLKSSYGDEPDAANLLEVISDLFSAISNKPSIFFKNLSIIDLMSCIFQLRINSLGDRTNVGLNIDETKRTLEFRLDWANEDLITFDKEFIKKTIEAGPIKVYIEAPSLQRLLEKTDEEYLYFVKNIQINEKLIEINSNKEAKEITEMLPIKVTLAIIEHFESIVNNLKSLNFLARYKIIEHNLGFVPSIESLIWFTKLMFNESLEAFYDNIFYLAKLANIPPSYTESCSIGEYYVYVNALKRSLAQQSEGRQEDSSVLHNDGISDFPDQ